MTTTSENPDAGQGPVLLDIGGDVGALIVSMPPETEGLEVEVRPRGATARKATDPGDGVHPHRHEHAHPHGPSEQHDRGHPRFPHVAVVGRRAPGGVLHCLVYPSLVAGDYELCPIPGDDIIVTATVVGGAVTQLESPEGMVRLR